MRGYVSDGMATAVLPIRNTGITVKRKPSSGISCGQMTATVPIGSFMAIAMLRNGGLCTAPSNLNEPIGTVAVICPQEMPLLGFLSTVMPVLAMGNTAVAIPSETYPLITVVLYPLFDTSDLPGGGVNIVSGYRSQLLKVLVEDHD